MRQREGRRAQGELVQGRGKGHKARCEEGARVARGVEEGTKSRNVLDVLRDLMGDLMGDLMHP